MYPRGIIDKFLSLCLGFFLAVGLLYLGIQLLIAILPWLITFVALAVIAAGGFALRRWRRERW